MWTLWRAHESRLSRESLRFMDDMIAVGGLQGEMHDPKEKKKTSSHKVTPVGYNKHAEKRWKEGYPQKRNWNEVKERRAREAFTRSIDKDPRRFAQVDIGEGIVFDLGIETEESGE